jgi:hypothetical protein
MHYLVGRLAFSIALCSACAGSSSPRAGQPRVERDLITQEQLREYRFTNAYEAVEALRSNWLLTRGTDSFSNPSQVQVYYDNARLGGIEQLRAIEINAIMYIRYYDGVEATGRWGLDHGQGVIFVSSRRDSNRGS